MAPIQPAFQCLSPLISLYSLKILMKRRNPRFVRADTHLRNTRAGLNLLVLLRMRYLYFHMIFIC